jgi:putative serine protease PepD
MTPHERQPLPRRRGRRSSHHNRGVGSPGATLTGVIQTSAAIYPGNSGGALVDLAGDVVGIPTLTATDPQIGGTAPGIGFAIPANAVAAIARQLITSGHVTNPSTSPHRPARSGMR